MSDDNRTVAKHLRVGREHLSALLRRREAAQALAAAHLAQTPQAAADAAVDPPSEAPPP